MLEFPTSLEVEANDGKILHFQLMRVCHNVLAIQENLHALKTRDDLIFGYIVLRDDYLYAYSVTMKMTPGEYRLIFMTYLGSEDKISEMDPSVIQDIFHSIALAFARISICENRHPAIVDKETFSEVYQTLKKSIDADPIGPETPFVEPMYDLAKELEEFYHSMAENLIRLNKNQQECMKD